MHAFSCPDEEGRDCVDIATLLMLSQQGDSKACVIYLFFFSLCGHNMSAVLGLWLLSLCGVTVLSLPDGYQVSFVESLQ